MATIGTINVSLKAGVKKFKKQMQSAAGSVRDFGANVVKNTLNVAKWGAALGAVAAGGLSVIVKREMAAIDATAKFADRIGATTEGLVGLQHAAELTGVKTRALQMGLQRMTRRIAEAAQGTGEAKAALKELGLDAAALNRMAPEEAFREIAEAMEGVSLQADKVRLSMKLFDSEGVALVNTLAMGKEGLAGVEEEARKLGIAFSRIDAAQVEAANDAMTRVGATFTGMFRQLTIKLAPFVEAAATAFTDWANSGEGAAMKVVDAFEWVVKAIAKTAKIGQQAAGVLTAGFGSFFEIIFKGAQKYIDFINSLPGWMVPLRDVYKKIGMDIDGWAEALGDAGAEMEKLVAKGGEMYDAAEDAERKAAEFFDKIRSSARERAAALVHEAEIKKAATAAALAVDDAFANVAVIGQTRDAMALAAAGAEDFMRATEKTRPEMESIELDAEQLHFSMQDVVTAQEEVAKGAKEHADAAERAADAGERTAEAAKTAAQAMKQDITKRFENFGGRGGLFGFGKGRAGQGAFSPFAPVIRKKRRRTAGVRTPGAPSAPSVSEGIGEGIVASVTAAVETAGKAMEPATKALEELMPSIKGLADQVKGAGDAMRSFARETRGAVVDATGRLRDEVVRLRSEVRTMKDDLARASDLGVA